MKNIKIELRQISAKIETVPQIAKASLECANEIKKNANALFYKERDTHKYANGWTFKMKKDAEGDFGLIYNKDEPQLSHLLEFGHITRYAHGKYGKLRKWIPPQRHIADAYDKCKDEYVKDCENIKIKWKTEVV